MWKYIIKVAIMLACFSCGSNEDKYDPIKLSDTNIECSYEEGDCTVSTVGESWWLRQYVVIDSHFTPVEELITTYENNNPEFPPVKIEGDWFVITKGVKNISVQLSENETKGKRMLVVPLQDHDYYRQLTIVQGVKTNKD